MSMASRLLVYLSNCFLFILLDGYNVTVFEIGDEYDDC